MTVICDVHGPMKRREALLWWECPGWDGEGCPVQLVYDEGLRRVADAGIPGVTVLP